MLVEVELEVDVDVEKRRPVTRRPVTNKLQVNRPTRYIKANKIHSQ
jgi:hypothetical protein